MSVVGITTGQTVETLFIGLTFGKLDALAAGRSVEVPLVGYAECVPALAGIQRVRLSCAPWPSSFMGPCWRLETLTLAQLQAMRRGERLNLIYPFREAMADVGEFEDLHVLIFARETEGELGQWIEQFGRKTGGATHNCTAADQRRAVSEN